MSQDIGTNTASWQRGHIGQFDVGILWIGDASGSADDEEQISISEPAAGSNDLTLPASVTGYKYMVWTVGGAGGSARLQTTGGDTINGLAPPFVMVAPAVYLLVCFFGGVGWSVTQIA
jgi:hypothetical protein